MNMIFLMLLTIVAPGALAQTLPPVARPPIVESCIFEPGRLIARFCFARPYRVFDIRGWYIGADPDGRVRYQLAHDPAQTIGH
jgi:hypothetical protein